MEAESIKEVEVEIGSATFLITADEETSPLTTLAAVCAANIEANQEYGTTDVAPTAPTEPIKINLKRVLEQNEELYRENHQLKEQLAKMSERMQRMVSGEVERMVALDVENKSLKEQINQLQEQLKTVHLDRKFSMGHTDTLTDKRPAPTLTDDVEFKIQINRSSSPMHVDMNSTPSTPTHIERNSAPSYYITPGNTTKKWEMSLLNKTLQESSTLVKEEVPEYCVVATEPGGEQVHQVVVSSGGVASVASSVSCVNFPNSMDMKWMTVTSPNDIENNYQNVLREHEINTTSKFNRIDISDNFRSFQIHNLKSRIKWEDKRLNIPYCGLPFISLGRMLYRCHQGKQYKWKDNDILEVHDVHGYSSRKKGKGKKVDCPAECNIYHLVYFLDMKIPRDSLRYMRMKSTELRKYLASNTSLRVEHKLLFKLAPETDHKNHLTGEGSGRQLPLDQSVLDKIKELVIEHGVIKLSEMRTHINLFVQHNYPNVSKDNRSYYPLNKDLLCHIYTTRQKAGIYNKKSAKTSGRSKRQKKNENRERHGNWENKSCSDYSFSKH